MVISKSLKEQIEQQLFSAELVRIPASEEEYFSVAQALPFKIEYHENEIITIGLATPWHEIVIMNFGRIFGNIFLEEADMLVLGSNTGVKIPKFEGGYYMPDVLVMKGEPVFSEKSNCIITNPYIIVEVLSPVTKAFDLSEKLPEYKLLESLQRVIYVNPNKVSVSSFTRSKNQNGWLNQDFYELQDVLVVAGVPIVLSDIYRKIKFEN